MKANIKSSVALAALAVLVGTASAAVVPTPSSHDSRIRIVPYEPNNVTVVNVQRGVVTRIMLEQDERIVLPAVGLSSDCEREADEWCISAVVGTNQIVVRPRDNAVRNNLELTTSKRDYSIEFKVIPEGAGLPDARSAKREVAFYRVIFEYPKPKSLAPVMTEGDRAAAVDGLLRRVDAAASRPLPQSVDPDYGMTPVQRLQAEGIQVRNSNYTKQVLDKGEDADPTMVFDDGRFTYFEYPGAREIPAVFAEGSDGQPTRVNWHMNGNFLVVQRTAKKFTLRLGEAVVGIFNESYDSTGIETPTSTVSPAVVREVKGGAK
ncbi:hypothetical protein EIP75_21595 [Aquabacterium soli]|uniref:Type IV secretion system protein VirB9 n=1 Tax=Aquabacterium soli TaxID=2493092 RepID=A0A426V2T1_9BURK|nr:TrbG/VirB9 family P-type conjugative transfer protein [Aquabacterium soli]RRS01172.1 hypothetical protein EIP75_21595 [Aquabacterium soli]